jgi:20S proteasome alpha/beta subunit
MLTKEEIIVNDSLVEEIKPMTTILGIKSANGVVIASDSQATSTTVKNLNVTKTFKINESIAIGCSGDAHQIGLLVEHLQQTLGQSKYETEFELRRKVSDDLLNIQREHNVNRAVKLGLPPALFFKPEALLAAKIEDNSFYLYLLTSDGWVYPISNHHAIGSGYILSNLVLNQQARLPNFLGKTFSDLDLKYNLWIASYVINEVKAFDPYTGGDTKVVFVDEDGDNEMPHDKVSEYYHHTIDQIAGALSQFFDNNKAIVDIFKNWYPK